MHNMNCIRCGRELTLGQVFCKECQAEMEKHPVDSSTPVILPPPVSAVSPRRSTRKVRKPEEQLSRLRRMMVSIIMVFTIIILAGTLLIYALTEKINTLEQTITIISEQNDS